VVAAAVALLAAGAVVSCSSGSGGTAARPEATSGGDADATAETTGAGDGTDPDDADVEAGAPGDPGDPADLRSVDWRGRTYEVCDVTASLVDGRWQDADRAVVVTLDQVQYGDGDGDGDDDALLSFSCAPLGGNAYPLSVNLVFTAGSDGPSQLGAAFPGAQATIVAEGVQTIDPVWAGGDPRSSPSGSRTTRWRFQDGAWASTVLSDDTPAEPPEPAPTPAPAPAPPGGSGGSGDLPQVDGYGPVGSGCSPGPGALPDGWWFGYPSSAPSAGGSFGFDLACYRYEEMADVEHGHDDVVVTNENTTLRTVTVAADATFTCSTVIGDQEMPSCNAALQDGVWVRIQGGTAAKVVTQLWWE
jgi:hypothetical protein